MAKGSIIEIDYEPRNWAMTLHDAVVRWIVLVIHRRAGKSTAALNHLQRDALENPNTTYAYIAPTYKQAKRIIWKMAMNYAREIKGVKFNSAELLITYENGSQIMILGSDDPDSLRGIALWGCFLDEYAQQSPIVFTEVISKALADHEGYCIFGGTPKGKNHFFRIYQTALKNPDRYALIYKTIDESLAEEDGPVITALRNSLAEDRLLVKDGIMTQDEFEQEWYLSFEAAIKGAVYLIQLGVARKEGRITDVPYDDRYPVYTVFDLGISKGNSMAVGFYQKFPGKVHMIDHEEHVGMAFKDFVKILKEKPYIYGRHFLPHDARNRDKVTGRSLYDSACTLLGEQYVEIVPKLGITDGIDLARSMFGRCYFDTTKCETFLDFLGQYHYAWDELRNVSTKLPIHDYTSNCFTGDTKVLTRNGTYQIMDLPDDGQVFTPLGWKKYQKLGITRKNASLVEVIFHDGTKVRCTPDHLFLTTQGWKSADMLKKGSLIQSHLTPLRNFSMATYIKYGQVRTILVRAGRYFTEMCGWTLLAPYPLNVTSTIVMGIQKIICSITSSVSTLMNICLVNGIKTNQILKNTSLLGRASERDNGISQMKEGYGIKEICKKIEYGKNGQEKKGIVEIVAMLLKPFLEKGHPHKDIVLTPAKPCIIENVLKVSSPEDVYDICVEDTHCFSLSNGAIVHNSADSFRYAATVEDMMLTDVDTTPTPKSPAPLGDDEYVGGVDEDDDTPLPDGMAKHPTLKGINVGMLGAKKPGS